MKAIVFKDISLTDLFSMSFYVSFNFNISYGIKSYMECWCCIESFSFNQDINPYFCHVSLGQLQLYNLFIPDEGCLFITIVIPAFAFACFPFLTHRKTEYALIYFELFKFCFVFEISATEIFIFSKCRLAVHFCKQGFMHKN